MLIPIAIGVLIIGYGAIELIALDADKSYYKGKCKGRLLSIYDVETKDPTGEYKQKRLKFRYEVDNKPYEGSHIQQDSDYTQYIIGRDYPLLYHLDNPKDFMVSYTKEPTSLYYLSIIAGVALIILTSAGIVRI
jgi:hypothetical protein